MRAILKNTTRLNHDKLQNKKNEHAYNSLKIKEFIYNSNCVIPLNLIIIFLSRHFKKNIIIQLKKDWIFSLH